MSVLNDLKKKLASVTWRGGNTANPSYDAAAVNKLNKDWQPNNVSGAGAIAESWELMTSRIRDLIRNDPVLTKALNMMVTLTIGPGIQSYSEAEDADGEYFDEFAVESDRLFGDQWAIEEADVEKRQTFFDMQRLSYKELVQTGCSIWLEVLDSDPRRSHPLSYQLLEYEQLDRTRDRPAERGRNRIINGIELDRFNRVLAVYLYDAHPYDTRSVGAFSTTGRLGHRSKRIPAERVILNYVPDRISSNIGVTWFSSLVQTSRDRDRMLANELTSRAVAALMTLFVKRENPGTCVADGLNAESTDTNKSNVTMGYPSIVELAREDSIEIAQSKGGSDDAATFVDLLLSQTAMGAGMSKNRLIGDPEQANLASIRSAHLDDERLIAPIQSHQINKIIRPIRRRHTEIAAAMGSYKNVSANEFANNRQRLQRLFIVPGGDPDIQPKEEGEAAIDRMRSGRSSPQYEIARTGFYWRPLLRQIKQYHDMLQKLGLGQPDLTKGSGGVYLPFVPLEEQPALQKAGRPTEGANATSD